MIPILLHAADCPGGEECVCGWANVRTRLARTEKARGYDWYGDADGPLHFYIYHELGRMRRITTRRTRA